MLIVDACLPLISLQNGNIRYSKPILVAETFHDDSLEIEKFEIYPFETVASITCDDGYIQLGPESRICQDSGIWTGDTNTCVLLEGYF